ncbi:MAG: acyl-CoA dehydrogenase, partial [Gammaproteobacteria bacterium]|nr:acyl-CoA dehydrogenase [Gammaproteobacteria bacterium]
TAAVTVMVPNSLGPGELLLHYGTAAQRDRYLPRLATGEHIPAFALTSTWAGSDAASMIDEGIVAHGEHEGRRVLGLRLNWDKRYITLAPVCTVLGLAFKARDPDGLLGERVELGITCALIPTDLPGVEIGDRHYPGMSFQNGPTRGKDVFIPMDFVVGGREQVGQGWRMLMDCLAVGRAISLPALGVAAGKLCCHTTGAYARVRRQFRVPIGRFEGVQEALARIAGETWRMNAGRIVTADALNRGEKPSILSAILKYHNTEGMRRVVGHAMDIHGGRAVCDGPANYLRSLYDAVPFAITVEGANILTRSLIIFGQGAIRCHPYLLRELRAAANADEAEGLRDFDAAFFAHLSHTLGNAVRGFILGITGARFTSLPDTGLPPRYLRQMTRFSAAFAVIGDVALLVLAGDLKRRETLSARLGDVLSHLYLGSAVVKHHFDNGAPESDRAVVEWALQDSLASIEERFGEFLDNFPNRIAARLLKRLAMPFGRVHARPGDALGRQVADTLLEPSETRDRLTEGVYFARDENDPVGALELALEVAVAFDAAENRIRKAYGRSVNAGNLEEFLDRGVAEGVIGETEAAGVRRAMSLTDRVLAVDTRAPAVSGG